MNNTRFKYPDTAAYSFMIDALAKRGVTIDDICKISLNLSQEFFPEVTMKQVQAAAINVLHKREVMNNAMVGLELDRLATQGLLSEPLESIIMNDAGVFGVDEGLALSIANIYGTIGVTNYGFIDRNKTGIIKKLDQEKNGESNTFIDDIVGAIASAITAKIAHSMS